MPATALATGAFAAGAFATGAFAAGVFAAGAFAAGAFAAWAFAAGAFARVVFRLLAESPETAGPLGAGFSAAGTAAFVRARDGGFAGVVSDAVGRVAAPSLGVTAPAAGAAFVRVVRRFGAALAATGFGVDVGAGADETGGFGR